MSTDISSCSDDELERMWQASAMSIEMFMKAYYSKNGNESDRVNAEKAQDRQEVIHKEITRRHK